MPSAIDDLCFQLALANRIVAHEGVLDGFGHISVRHPDKPDHYLLSRSRSPELVEPGDILELDAESDVVTPGDILPYGECVIHGEIFRARPDVMAIVHHHSPALLPFCITDLKLVPVNSLGATMGAVVPSWDGRDEFGDTPMVLTTNEEGASLARALGPHSMVLMRRHGVTVVGASLKEVVFRSIMTHRNAEHLLRAISVSNGKVEPLSEGEQKLSETYSLAARPLGRAWEYWVTRLTKAGELPPRTKTLVGKGKASSKAKPAGKAKKSVKKAKRGGRR
ncbi:MAG TPA: class II aldolase/adducin family protein [Xanthobacteraceae bacterium]|nr:class II aldolase/adducin family protein [Xanthobacteraceae bacterium]